jgi:protein-L-isoaspartate(D-aspartate) O-methyltransferase
MSDYAARRRTMVDTQVRPSDVTKFPIIEAMLTVPRESFVPQRLRHAAYVGETLQISPERVLLEPRTLAKMLDALDVRDDEMVLSIGAGLGYSSAVIARMSEAVIALESDESLASEAEAALADVGADNVAVVTGDLAAGAAKHGPYDVILIEGGVGRVPSAILDQLKDGGRIACVFMEGALGVCRIGLKVDGNVNWRFSFNASAPVLSGFEVEEDFAL